MAKLNHPHFSAKDFSAAERRALLKRGIRIVGSTAVPAFEGDRYFSGRAYMLDIEGKGCLRGYMEVCAIAAGA